MLGHQLPVLPPFEQFWESLKDLFRWLEGAEIAPALAPLAAAADEDQLWTPPATVGVWGTGIPLEEVRFAAVNHLCVELGYQGSTRLIEPYSLRRTREGNLVLHALRHESGAHRSYRVDRVQTARATTVPFTRHMPSSSAPQAHSPHHHRRAARQRSALLAPDEQPVPDPPTSSSARSAASTSSARPETGRSTPTRTSTAPGAPDRAGPGTSPIPAGNGPPAPHPRRWHRSGSAPLRARNEPTRRLGARRESVQLTRTHPSYSRERGTAAVAALSCCK